MLSLCIASSLYAHRYDNIFESALSHNLLAQCTSIRNARTIMPLHVCQRQLVVHTSTTRYNTYRNLYDECMGKMEKDNLWMCAQVDAFPEQ